MKHVVALCWDVISPHLGGYQLGEYLVNYSSNKF